MVALAVLVAGGLAGAGHVGASPASSGNYALTDLVSGATSVTAFDVNGRGDVVGEFDDAQGAHGFLIDGSGLHDLSVASPGFPFGVAPHAINDVGAIAGTATVLVNGQYRNHAVLRDVAGVLIDLGTLGGIAFPLDNSFGLDINSSGVVVGSSEFGTGSARRAFLSFGLTMSAIGPLSTGSFVSANSINDQGQVVGTDDRGDQGLSTAFRYAAGTTTTLPSVAGAQGMFADAINASGVVVGHADLNYPCSFGQCVTGSPVQWAADDILSSLGAWGRATAINCHGDAVGNVAAQPTDPQPVTLYQAGQTVDLSGELPTGGGGDQPVSINGKGQIIVDRFISGASRAYLLTPITPQPDCPAFPGPQAFGPPGSGGIAVNPTGSQAEPVNTATGNYWTTTTDIELPGIGLPFAFARSYNSADSSVGELGGVGASRTPARCRSPGTVM